VPKLNLGIGEGNKKTLLFVPWALNFNSSFFEIPQFKFIPNSKDVTDLGGSSNKSTI
jgi:hypothetical protein